MKKKIDQMMVDLGLITEEQRAELLNKVKGTGKTLGRMAVELEYISEEDIVKVYAEKIGIGYCCVDINDVISNEIPLHIMQKHRVVPVGYEDDNFKDCKKIKLAMVNPLNVFAIDDVELLTGKRVVPLVSSEQNIMNALLHIEKSEDKV